MGLFSLFRRKGEEPRNGSIGAGFRERLAPKDPFQSARGGLKRRWSEHEERRREQKRIYSESYAEAKRSAVAERAKQKAREDVFGLARPSYGRGGYGYPARRRPLGERISDYGIAASRTYSRARRTNTLDALIHGTVPRSRAPRARRRRTRRTRRRPLGYTSWRP